MFSTIVSKDAQCPSAASPTAHQLTTHWTAKGDALVHAARLRAIIIIILADLVPRKTVQLDIPAHPSDHRLPAVQNSYLTNATQFSVVSS